MAFKTKAELAFERKASQAIRNGDFDRLTELGLQFESYLLLVAEDEQEDDEEPAPEAWVPKYVPTPEHAEWCRRVLQRDPVTLLPLRCELPGLLGWDFGIRPFAIAA